MSGTPTEEEVLDYFTSLSNWGRWGPDDELGTLNHITADRRREASALIRSGRSVSCSWAIETGSQVDDFNSPPQRYMINTGQGLADAHRLEPDDWLTVERQHGASEFIGLVFHGFRITHLDALSHSFWDGRMYNDQPAELVSSYYGATRHAITAAGDGIFTRGVLLDVPRHRGVDWLEPGEPVHRSEVEAVLAADRVELVPGDALILRTGYGRRRVERGPDDLKEMRGARAGWHASCLPFFREHDVALIAADTAQDVVPTGYETIRRPIHAIGISAMGLWLLDNCNLEALARACTEEQTTTFAFVVSVLPFAGATGSPVNPLALF